MTSFNNDWILQLDFHNLHLNTYYVYVKEACNWGHGLSAAIKLGSLEKTVGTCLLRSGVCYDQSFSCRINCTTQLFAFVGDSPVFLQKKRLAFFYGAKLIFRSFATFFGQMPNKGFALLAQSTPFWHQSSQYMLFQRFVPRALSRVFYSVYLSCLNRYIHWV